MSEATILSKDNDMIDALCKAHYGREDPVPAVLEANPHLAKLPALLPAGIRIVLPEVDTASESTPEVRIWG